MCLHKYVVVPFCAYREKDKWLTPPSDSKSSAHVQILDIKWMLFWERSAGRKKRGEWSYQLPPQSAAPVPPADRCDKLLTNMLLSGTQPFRLWYKKSYIYIFCVQHVWGELSATFLAAACCTRSHIIWKQICSVVFYCNYFIFWSLSMHVICSPGFSRVASLVVE